MVDVVKTVRVSDAMDKQLDKISKRLHKSDSDLIREAILILIRTYSKDMADAAKT